MLKRIFGAHLIQKLDLLNTYAAALSYCFVLSLVPFLAVTFTFASHLVPEQFELTKAYGHVLKNIIPTESPLETMHLVTAVESASHGTWATFGLGLAFYTSYTLMTQIVRTLLFIFDDPRRPQEWNWTISVKTLGLFAIWMTLLLVISMSSVPKAVIDSVLARLDLAAQPWQTLWELARYVVIITSLFTAFYFTYRLVPSRRYARDQVLGGSLVASLGWIGGGLVFAYLLPLLWSLNSVYRALGSMVIVLLWAQVCAWSVIAGACWIVRFSPHRK